jgi:hypothetical protein
VRPVSVEESCRVEELAILREHDRCELTRGLILEKKILNPAHKKTMRLLIDMIHPRIPDKYMCDTQSPITLDDSMPEPDASIIVGPADRYDDRHGSVGEVVCLIEIADSTLQDDRGDKLTRSAETCTAMYWIANLHDQQIEVYTHPRTGRTPTYRTRTDFREGLTIPIVLGKKRHAHVFIDEILP